MKGPLAIAVAGLILLSCNKEETINPRTSATQINQLKASPTVLIWKWDEWGRKKRDCDGGGLCNFRRDKEAEKAEQQSAGFRSTPIFSDADGNRFIEVWADQGLQFEDASQALFIDENIVNTDPEDGITIIAPAGVYPFNAQIGEMGGYIIPVTVSAN